MYVEKRASPWDYALKSYCSVEADGAGDPPGGAGGGAPKSGEDDALARVLAKNEELLAEAKAAKAKLRDYDAAEAIRKADAEKAADAEARKKGEFEKIETSYQEKVAKAESDANGWKYRFEQRVIGDELRDALDKEGVRPEFRKAVTLMMQTDAEFEIDDTGKVTVGGKSVADFVKVWAVTPDGKAYIANGSSGGGAPGGGKGGAGANSNPFKAGEGFSLTAQGALFKSDPARARALAAEAGIVL